jgi:hypothetical protein
VLAYNEPISIARWTTPNNNNTTSRNGITVVLELLQNDNTMLRAGESIQGNIMIDNKFNKKIRKVEVILRAIEFAGMSPLNISGYHSISKELATYTMTIDKEYRETLCWTNEQFLYFQIQIPAGAKSSYIGYYSQYFWMLEVKLNVAWSRDVHIYTYLPLPKFLPILHGTFIASHKQRSLKKSFTRTERILSILMLLLPFLKILIPIIIILILVAKYFG